MSTLTSIMQLFRREDVALAMQCLERVELAHKARERTDSLSGGRCNAWASHVPWRNAQK